PEPDSKLCRKRQRHGSQDQYWRNGQPITICRMPQSRPRVDRRTLFRALSRARSPAAVADAISAAVCTLLDADAAVLCVREGDDVAPAAVSAWPPVPLTDAITPLATWVIHNASAAAVPDVLEDASGLPVRALRETSLRGVLVVP